jgi:phage-related protein
LECLNNIAKPIQWLGDSRDRLRRFPQAARREIGYQLSLIQAGRSASDWRPIALVGTGVIEIRVHADGEYRVFYVAKFEDAVYVLHVFAKRHGRHPHWTLSWGRSATVNCWKGRSDASDKRQ